MAEVHHGECMFCRSTLPTTEENPVNLAFMDHIEGKPSCSQEFEYWTHNMARDFLGD